ncbi:hypothetical protein [Flavisolibacter tropicus]|uniref:hypothetical protein n=1 Tax=Flavisolibacter tropicus TaxID=1492898 RepID=UPI00131428B4|nr:hypothetical protein [Flavisolibacter tropicus]
MQAIKRHLAFYRGKITILPISSVTFRLWFSLGIFFTAFIALIHFFKQVFSHCAF